MQSGVKSSLVWLFILSSTSFRLRLNRAGLKKSLSPLNKFSSVSLKVVLINGNFSANSKRAHGNKINVTKILKDW